MLKGKSKKTRNLNSVEAMKSMFMEYVDLGATDEHGEPHTSLDMVDDALAQVVEILRSKNIRPPDVCYPGSDNTEVSLRWNADKSHVYLDVNYVTGKGEVSIIVDSAGLHSWENELNSAMLVGALDFVVWLQRKLESKNWRRFLD